MPRVLGVLNLSTQSCLLLVLLPMAAAVVVLRVVFAFVPPPRPDMLLQADGLVEQPDVSSAQAHTAMPITLPNDLLGGSVYVVGVYTEGAGTLPPGSADIVLTRDGSRFVEIVERPGTALADVVNDYPAERAEPVALGSAVGTLVTRAIPSSRCVSPNEKFDLPGFCALKKMLFFERAGIVYSIAADGTHATDGELILLAKDLLEP